MACRAGWFAIVLGGGSAFGAGVVPALTRPGIDSPGASLILMDIPLGLLFRGARGCGLEARRRLGRRCAASVFPPPCRGAIDSGPMIRKCHPELAFRGLAGRAGPYHGKKTAQAREERLAVLRRHGPDVEAFYHALRIHHPRRYVADDDILDALALALAARAGAERLVSPPQPPEFDALGLPMEIVSVGFGTARVG